VIVGISSPIVPFKGERGAGQRSGAHPAPGMQRFTQERAAGPWPGLPREFRPREFGPADPIRAIRVRTHGAPAGAPSICTMPRVSRRAL
jgi:hypothetical protein